jgi:hypothetical protein
MNSGLIGAVIGSIIGILGATAGTYFSIKNTDGPKEKAFMIRIAIIAWLAVLAFIGLTLVLSRYYKYLLWILDSVFHCTSCRYQNSKS